jgi:hypothetical protein
VRTAGAPPKRAGWQARTRHGFLALQSRPALLLALVYGWGALAVVLMWPFAMDLVTPGRLVRYGEAPVEYRGRTYQPREAGYDAAFGRELQRRRELGGAGAAADVALQLALLASIARFGGKVLRGQARAEAWACRYPLRFRVDEWLPLEGIVNSSGILAAPAGSPWRGAQTLYRVTPSREERSRLATYLEAYDRDLPPGLDRSRLLGLAASLTMGRGLYYVSDRALREAE